MMLRLVKPLVERFPAIAACFRAARDEWWASRVRALATPRGFKLAGSAQMQAGLFEIEESSLLERLLQEADVFVDVGANIGFYTCFARRQGKHVVAIEPSAGNVRLLHFNLYANEWDDVEVFPVALGRRPGLAALYGGNTGASLVPGWAGISTVYRSIVPVSTLDIVVGERFRSEKLLVKMDVEGAEYDVLQGAGRLVTRDPAPDWMVEVCLCEHHPSGFNLHFQDVFEIFWRSGYRAWTVKLDRMVTPSDVERWVAQRRQDFGSHNFVFRRR